MTNIKKFQKPTQHCFWVWYEEPVHGEAYESVFADSPEEALKMTKPLNHYVKYIWDVYSFKNYYVSRGTITS